MLLAVACGAAAPPVPTAAPRAAPAAPAAAQPAAPAAPKAIPTPTPAPAVAATVNPGKLTVMLAELGNERFDYIFATTSAGGRSYARMLYGYLISENERKQMVPGIASQWGLSADGLTWTFKIRKGVKFHDGSEVTPQDILWTLQHFFSPQAVEWSKQNTSISLARIMNRIELSGPDEVSVTTKEPYTGLPLVLSEGGVWSFGVMPKRTKLHDLEQEAAYDNNFIGAGPLRLARHVKAYALHMERFNDFYYQPKNGFHEDKRVNFRSLDLIAAPEEATRVAAIRAGEADLVPTSQASIKQVEAGGGRVVYGQEGSVHEVRLVGCWKPEFPCHDKRVRQALDYAINKELIRDKLYSGSALFQVKGWVGVTPSSIAYSPELDPRPFDPNKARQLLAEAGYPGGKGFGKLTVHTWISSTPFIIEAAQLAADFWKRELGLDVEVKVSEEGALKKRQYARELDGQILWRDNETKLDITTTLISQYGDPKSDNRFHENPELYRTVKETVQILDEQKRTEALNKLLVRLRDESYWLSVGYVNIPWAVGPRVLDWRPYPLVTYPSALHTIILK
jgi:peptide/nickel transport system substrate-binding protein